AAVIVGGGLLLGTMGVRGIFSRVGSPRGRAAIKRCGGLVGKPLFVLECALLAQLGGKTLRVLRMALGVLAGGCVLVGVLLERLVCMVVLVLTKALGILRATGQHHAQAL